MILKEDNQPQKSDSVYDHFYIEIPGQQSIQEPKIRLCRPTSFMHDDMVGDINNHPNLSFGKRVLKDLDEKYTLPLSIKNVTIKISTDLYHKVGLDKYIQELIVNSQSKLLRLITNDNEPVKNEDLHKAAQIERFTPKIDDDCGTSSYIYLRDVNPYQLLAYISQAIKDHSIELSRFANKFDPNSISKIPGIANYMSGQDQQNPYNSL